MTSNDPYFFNASCFPKARFLSRQTLFLSR
ncbi:hypothetical protein KSP9073_02080 [Kushneria phyllosphaerae]|uniref:Uncharacterized protein n=1 Tax=Kushneria phyllosphaerae TaxID=2100822 RepID=A0A2R8CMC0_9GAMM|nr:hypothetical protein KSP9073_02080 [Kushneria phyllosphaerae]